LLPDASQLLVLSEGGELVLIRANPDKLDEIARHKVLEGRCGIIRSSSATASTSATPKGPPASNSPWLARAPRIQRRHRHANCNRQTRIVTAAAGIHSVVGFMRISGGTSFGRRRQNELNRIQLQFGPNFCARLLEATLCQENPLFSQKLFSPSQLIQNTTEWGWREIIRLTPKITPIAAFR